MRYLFFALLLFGCAKEEFVQPAQDCKTCTEYVHYVQYGVGIQDYIANTEDHCNGTWAQYNGKTWVAREWVTNGIRYKETHTIKCQ